MSEPLTLLTVHAHPDDEASKGAPTLAMYKARGVRTILVCCTGGEEGDLQNPALREEGQAFPNDFDTNSLSSDLHLRFQDALSDELEQVDETFAVAGRIMAKRVMGKIAFVRLQDRGGHIQLMIQRDNLPEGVFQKFKHWDIGDIVGASGHIVRTQKGELSIRVGELRQGEMGLHRPLAQLPATMRPGFRIRLGSKLSFTRAERAASGAACG